MISNGEFQSWCKAVHFGGDADHLFELINGTREGRITYGEFKAAILGKGTVDLDDLTEYVSRMYKSDPLSAFAAGCDIDGNAELGREEFARWLVVKLNFPGDANKIFDQLDINRDGSLTWKEFQNTILKKSKSPHNSPRHSPRHSPRKSPKNSPGSSPRRNSKTSPRVSHRDSDAGNGPGASLIRSRF